jgi:hypothetical protein
MKQYLRNVKETKAGVTAWVLISIVLGSAIFGADEKSSPKNSIESFREDGEGPGLYAREITLGILSDISRDRAVSPEETKEAVDRILFGYWLVTAAEKPTKPQLENFNIVAYTTRGILADYVNSDPARLFENGKRATKTIPPLFNLRSDTLSWATYSSLVERYRKTLTDCYQKDGGAH